MAAAHIPFPDRCTDPTIDVETRETRYARYLALETLFPSGPFEAHWVGDALWFVVDDGPRRVLHWVDLDSDDAIGPIDIAAITAVLPLSTRGGDASIDRVERIDEGLRIGVGQCTVDFHLDDDHFEHVAEAAPSHPVPRGTFLRQLVLAPPQPVPDVPSPDGRLVATIVGGNVHVVQAGDGETRALTDDACDGVGWDLESGRRPFGRVKAMAVDPWSPDGRLLLAARIDRRAVRTVPLIDFLRDDIAVAPFHVEVPGTPLPDVAFHLLDPRSGAIIAVDLGDTTQALVNPVGWMPDGSECWFTRGSRDLTRVDVLAVDRGGMVRVVMVEAGTSFVRVQHDLLYPGNAGIVLLPDSSGFLWLSERSGWNHLYRIDRDGQVVRTLTSGDWPVLAVEAIDATEAVVYFTAHADVERPYDVQLFSVPLGGGVPRRLTDEPGQHRIAFSPSRRHFVDTFSSPAEPPVTVARSVDGSVLRSLHRTDIAALRGIGWRAPEEFVVKALDGVTDLWGVLYLPADFDASRRYPIVEHIYAGPQVAYVDRGFSLGHRYKPWNLPQALAQLGYAVVVLDAPGTPERSKRFHDEVLHAMGKRQIDEHAAALRELAATRPWLDLDRVGIFGHSWGAYYALRALADAPGLYRAAVASGPAFFPDSVMSEPYLGSDPQGPGYTGYDPLALAPHIRGDLMIVTGTAEVSMFHAAMRVTHALIEAGVRHELVVLPGQPHGYSGKAADYYLDATTRFFQRHLGDDRRPPAA